MGVLTTSGELKDDVVDAGEGDAVVSDAVNVGDSSFEPSLHFVVLTALVLEILLFLRWKAVRSLSITSSGCGYPGHVRPVRTQALQ